LQVEDVSRILEPYGFQLPPKADANLQAMAGDPQERQALSRILRDILVAVGQSADPDQGLNEWERYVQSGINRGQLFQFLAQGPRLLHLLCTIFGNSPAMAQTLIRDPLLVYWLGEESTIPRAPTHSHLTHMLNKSLTTFTTSELRFDALRRFMRREMLRIGIRDLLRHASVVETVTSLSDLANVVIQSAYQIVESDLRKKHGTPFHRDNRGKESETGFVVLGMGKLGGGELNYSSDVDLIYLYESSEGETRAKKGQRSISNETFFETLARELTGALADATQEGTVFRVDLRLRPEGSLGPLARSLDEAIRYYHSRGRDWERLAFIKARPIAGEKRVGQKFLRRLRRFVHGAKADPPQRVLQTIRSLKGQIQQKMVRRGENDRHVKLGTGGIREIEFIVQALQLLHVGRFPQVMKRNTLEALSCLTEVKALSKSIGEQLAQSYIFLRDVEHKLQMENELQTHLIPQDMTEVAKCAIRLGYSKKSSTQETATHFLNDYRRHSSKVHRFYNQIIG
jgi:glutamate-ammonia-ligase adenylyltransferase